MGSFLHLCFNWEKKPSNNLMDVEDSLNIIMSIKIKKFKNGKEKFEIQNINTNSLLCYNTCNEVHF